MDNNPKKKKNTPRSWWQRGIPLWIVVILLIASIATFATLQSTPDYVRVSTTFGPIPTRPAYGAPNTNTTYISPVESATPEFKAPVETDLSLPEYEQQQLIVSTCSNTIFDPSVGHFVFRIWLQQSMELFRIDENGEGFCYLTDDEYMDDQPAWSPDGERIAFVSNRDGYGIYLMKPDGSDIERILTGGTAYSFPTWSPDGQTLYYQATIDERFDIYAFDLQTGEQRNVTNHERLDTMPAISPDGQYIAFASDRSFNPYVDNNPQAQYDSFDIYVADIDGSNARRVTVEAGRDLRPHWSSDGSQIIYTNNRYQLVSMNPDGSNKHNLSSQHDAYDIDWMDANRVSLGRLRILNLTDNSILEIQLFPDIGSGVQYADYLGPRE